MKRNPFLGAVVYFIAVIVIAHFFVPSGYDWTQNTISDLASQGHINKWIMQAGFIGFGAVLTLGSAYHFWRNRRQWFLFLVAVYGLSILLSGIYCTAPIDPSMSFSATESELHSTFATLAGIGMSFGIVMQVVMSASNRERWMRIAFLLLVVGVSGLFGLAENHIVQLDKGIIQRILYLVGLAWLVYEERLMEAFYERK